MMTNNILAEAGNSNVKHMTHQSNVTFGEVVMSWYTDLHLTEVNQLAPAMLPEPDFGAKVRTQFGAPKSSCDVTFEE